MKVELSQPTDRDIVITLSAAEAKALLHLAGCTGTAFEFCTEKKAVEDLAEKLSQSLHNAGISA